MLENSRTYLRFRLNREQWLTYSELKAIQWRRLKKLLRHAYNHVPYYQRVFTELDLKPEDVRNMDDFRRLPFLRKTDIQTHLPLLLATNTPPESLKSESTSGSTGTPLDLYRDPRANRYKKAAFHRYRQWIGYRPESKIAFVWGAHADLPQNPRSNERWLNAFDFNQDTISNFVRELAEWKPHIIRGYPSLLYLIANLINKQNLPALRPRAIETGAEKLFPHQRILIEEIFQCPVFDQYGSREVPAIACECELHNGLHIFEDLHLMEIIKDGLPVLPGQEGSVVITDLTNYAMPFIRYEIGDLAVKSNRVCPCGRGFPLLEEVKGRIINLFTTPDGRYIYSFNRLFFYTKGISEYQVIQHSLNEVEVLIQPAENFSLQEVEAVIAKMKDLVGPEVKINWKKVDKIHASPSGKLHFTISRVPVDYLTSSQTILEEKSTIKPKILFIVDTPNWAHDLKTENLKQALNEDFEILKKFQSQIREEDLNNADLILIYFWLQLKSLKSLENALQRNQHKLLLGICSHHELEGSRRRPGLKLLRLYARAIFANSMLLYNQFKSYFNRPVFYTPNGVDLNFYHPPPNKSSSPELRLGWAGSLTNQGKMHRGYYDLIKPAAEKVEGVKLVTAAREEKWRSAEEMRDFYHSLDLYICASKSEGTPNPCLEAAACGIPLITTPVGNMPELVQDGFNGFFIDRNIDDIASKIALLKKNETLRRQMSENILSSIQSWDWKIQAENYRQMFLKILRD